MKAGYGLIANLTKPNAAKVAQKIAAYLKKHGKTLWVEAEANQVLKIKGVKTGSFQEVLKRSSALIALGGDGTILHLVRQMKRSSLPILGVNLGGLGFLTEVRVKELEGSLKKLLAKKYSVEKRMMLEAKVFRKKKAVASYTALNDVVITNGALARVIHLDVKIDKDYVTSYLADGLIVSSPTGSTAYSLSSGGPIVHPSTKSILVTPVSPHTLTNRPILIPDKGVLEIKVINPKKGAYLTVDGQVGLVLKSNDLVKVKKSSSSARLILLDKTSYFGILREKLRWGEIPSQKPKTK